MRVLCVLSYIAAILFCMFIHFMILSDKGRGEFPLTIVRDTMCTTEEAAIDYALLRAEGVDEILASDRINKRAEEIKCARYVAAHGVHGAPITMLREGVTVMVVPFLVYPEKLELFRATAQVEFLPRKDTDL